MEIPAQSSADFALTYNFQGTHILGASRGHLCDRSVFLFEPEVGSPVFSCTERVAWSRSLRFMTCRAAAFRQICTDVNAGASNDTVAVLKANRHQRP